MELKIGQEIVMTEDFIIRGLADSIQVKKGDKGYLDKMGFIHFTTGNARNKMVKFTDENINKYDTENIAKLIYSHIEWKFDIEEHLENYEIDTQNFIDEIDYVLSEIL